MSGQKQQTAKQHAALLKRAVKADTVANGLQGHLLESNFFDFENQCHWDLWPPIHDEGDNIGCAHVWLAWVADMHRAIDHLAQAAMSAQRADEARWDAVQALAGPDAESDDRAVWVPAMDKAWEEVWAAQREIADAEPKKGAA